MSEDHAQIIEEEYDEWEEFEAKLAENPKFREAWEKRRASYELARQMIGIRASAGLTQKEMAERAGMTQPEIARLESGQHRPSWETVARLLAAVDARVEVSVPTGSGKRRRKFQLLPSGS